ncbi:TetR/AcrR family transcriptional regulator [Sandaracinus amylolyticus]|uniref:Transcriptional regulator, TetR family protein n=1 Tax=Sandaracinus amylolyticus TaxID=927083 RepID=A0A0F6YM42_9BACT|nr:TetR/AcrR family transcriptional regulator [Sandaracinus amylolyticus]AKF10938.1 Transcriptional regulator, TetR family protein [Sandaracinus amylolyticus]
MTTKWTKEELERRFRHYLGDEDDDSAQARKRRRILRAAHELFLAQGYRKTSVDDVARKAEVAKGTVYLYFPNKGTLLEAAIALEKRGLMKRLGPLFDGSIPKRERLLRYLEITFTSGRDMPLVARMLTGDSELWAALEDIGMEAITQRQAEGAEFLMELIEDAVPGVLTDEQKRERAEVIIGVGFSAGMLLDERTRSGRSLDAFVRSLSEMLTFGVAGRRPEKKR